MIHFCLKEVGYITGRRVAYLFGRHAKKEDPMDDKLNEMKDNFTDNYFDAYR